MEELPDGIGFCLISNADRPENNLIKGGVFQTFLYEDRATEFFQKDGLNLVSSESSGRGAEGFTRHIGLLKNF